ncbi:MAG TPA: NAD(P)H-binding protein [Solirubrobacteraceae bacterium]|nr:NAD(P)H-binding protein [Solirubrobacteraceae bacterium]
MARCLIIGCGCRGLALTRELQARGHVVRATTRDERRAAAIRSAGAQAVIADPEHVATLAPALAQVGVVCLLLGSAQGGDEQLQALHGARLEALLGRLVDTTVRGVVYEAAGTVDSELLRSGASLVRSACERSSIGHVLLCADPADHERWPIEAASSVERALLG